MCLTPAADCWVAIAAALAAEPAAAVNSAVHSAVADSVPGWSTAVAPEMVAAAAVAVALATAGSTVAERAAVVAGPLVAMAAVLVAASSAEAGLVGADLIAAFQPEPLRPAADSDTLAACTRCSDAAASSAQLRFDYRACATRVVQYAFWFQPERRRLIPPALYFARQLDPPDALPLPAASRQQSLKLRA